MTDLNFHKIIGQLKEMHFNYPDMRFGQMVQLALDGKKLRKNADFSDVSSKEFLAGLKEFDVITKDKRKRSKRETDRRNKKVK